MIEGFRVRGGMTAVVVSGVEHSQVEKEHGKLLLHVERSNEQRDAVKR